MLGICVNSTCTDVFGRDVTHISVYVEIRAVERPRCVGFHMGDHVNAKLPSNLGH